MWRSVFISALFFLNPFFASAQVVITEIMYDLPGSDTDREWIEIFNGSNESINLADWRFVEGGEKHTLLPYPESGNVVLESSAYAVIAVKPDVFLLDWPGFSGKLYDSSFSLKNSEGEMLSIRNTDGADVDTVTYDPLLGASEDGNSLQKMNGSWNAVSPTPGEGNSANVNNGPSSSETTTLQNPSSSESSVSQDSSSYVQGGYTPPKNIKAVIQKRESIAMVGAASEFRGLAFGLEDEPIENARFVWGFGDGTTKEGKNILHTYQYPGTYIVSLSVSSGQYGAETRMNITSVIADVSLSNVGPKNDFFVELTNHSLYELNIGGWILVSGGMHFIIPRNTFILPNAILVLPHDATKLPYDESVRITTPDGRNISTHSSLRFVENTEKETPTEQNKNDAVGIPLAQLIASQEEIKQNIPRVDSDPTASPQVEFRENTETMSFSVAAPPQTLPTQSGDKQRLWLWILGTFLLISVGVGGFVVMRSKGPIPISDAEIEAEKFEIEEIEPNKQKEDYNK